VEEIDIDGFSNYITIDLPPLKNGIFQLMPVYSRIIDEK
jgi:hypothetical protein